MTSKRDHERDAELDKKIEALRRKNEALMKRYKVRTRADRQCTIRMKNKETPQIWFSSWFLMLLFIFIYFLRIFCFFCFKVFIYLFIYLPNNCIFSVNIYILGDYKLISRHARGKCFLLL